MKGRNNAELLAWSIERRCCCGCARYHALGIATEEKVSPDAKRSRRAAQKRYQRNRLRTEMNANVNRNLPRNVPY
jgi:hypothetical protein